jgi:hypothetical protein
MNYTIWFAGKVSVEADSIVAAISKLLECSAEYGITVLEVMDTEEKEATCVT